MITRYFRLHSNPGVDPVGENVFASPSKIKSLAHFLLSDPIVCMHELFCAAVLGLHEGWLELPAEKKNVMHFREPLKKTMHAVEASFDGPANIKGVSTLYCQLVNPYPDT